MIINSFKFKKSVQALNYFAKKEGGKINLMKAVKLVWLSDRVHLRIYGRSITNDQYLAMKHGLVPSGTKDIISKSQFFEREIIDYVNQFISDVEDYNFTSLSEIDKSVFSKTDLKILEQIYSYYGDKDQYQLSEYSHHFPEWLRFESNLKDGLGKRFNVVENDFFENGDIVDEPFSQDEELLTLSKEHYCFG